MAREEYRGSDIKQEIKELVYAQFKTEMSVDRLSREMREFRAEMRAFRAKTPGSEERARGSEGESADTTRPRAGSKGEITGYENRRVAIEDEYRVARMDIHRQWCDLAIKMGTIIEDIIRPEFSAILKRYFDADAQLIASRVQCKDPENLSHVREFDLIAVSDTYLFTNQTSSKPTVQNAGRFIKTYREVVAFFPQYADHTIVPIYSAISLPDEVVEWLSTNDCYALALHNEHLEVLNFDFVGA